MSAYDPRNWFWTVGGDTSRFWSSAAGAYVTELPPGFYPSVQAAVDADSDAGVRQVATRIASEAELNDVLRSYGLTLPAPTQADYSQAIQAHIDGVARSRNYADGVALASYTVSTIPAWAAEAQAFAAWRDAVWAYAYGELAKVMAGERAKPTIDVLIAELPAMVWPA